MQNVITEPLAKRLYSSEDKSRDIRSTYLKQDWFGSIPYYFSKKVLDTIQQVYSKQNRYVCSAVQRMEGIKASVYVDSLLGIKKQMSYVPASTISAVVSQCSALVLWGVLRRKADDPTAIYNRLVENELVGFKKERPIYHERIPLKTEIRASIQIMRVVWYKGNLVVRETINLGTYMETEILGYAFLSKI